MTGVVDGVRWSLLGTGSVPVETVAVSALVAVLILVSGLVWFRRMEKSFADVV
jgi:lipopolysaccharide transport system permease protein